MWRNNLKLALDSLKSSKWRSFLTMLGIIVGVVGVVTIVSIGEGVKQQITKQINRYGPELITVKPGKIVHRDAKGNVTGYNILGLTAAGNLNESDTVAIQKTSNAKIVVPMNIVPGVVTVADQNYENTQVIGAPDALPQALNQEMAFGAFYKNDDTNKLSAVIGKTVAKELFKENVPMGRSFEFHGRVFIVRGVFDEFPASPLTPTTDYNNAIFIPYDISKELTANQAHIYQILVKPSSANQVSQLASDITTTLRNSRGGQEDFTVLKQSETLALADSLLSLLTTMIAAVAAISLVVGGIGIMNVMLVSVTERTHEVGVRKAVGATNQQIMSQFLYEAAVLTAVGGVLGVVVSLFANYFIRLFTDLEPAITLPIMAVAVVVSLAVGIIFGTAPALKAARKDPIDALRNR